MKNVLRLTAVFALLLTLVLSASSCGAGKTDDKGFTYALDKATDTYIVKGYSGSAENVSVPETYNGVAVTAIGSSAFKGNAKIKTVIVPVTVKEIGDNAFNGCSELKTVEFQGAELTEIKTGTFAGCVKLDNVVLPSSVKTVGYKAFANCTAMKTVTLPESLEVIDYYAFSGCATLNDVKFNAEKEFKIYANAFLGCDDLQTFVTPALTNQKAEYIYKDGLLTEKIEGGLRLVKCLLTAEPEAEESEIVCAITADIIDIHPQAFTGRYNIKGFKVDAANGKYAVDDDGVLYSKDMKKLIAYPDSVKAESFTVGEGVETVGAYSFYGNVFLKNVSLPDSVKEIGTCAFGGDFSVETLTVGANKIKVGKNAFGKEFKTYANLTADTEYYIEEGVLFTDVKVGDETQTKLVCYPKDSDRTEYTVKKHVKQIADGAFRLNSSLSALKVEQGHPVFMTNNNDGVLYSFTEEGKPSKLIAYPKAKTAASYTVPESVSAIAASAFFENTSLKTLTLGKAGELMELTPYVLFGCSSLDTLNIKSGEIKLGERCVEGCAALKNVSYGGSDASWIKVVGSADDAVKKILENVTLTK